MSAETFLDGRVTLHCGDNREVMKGFADCSIDAIVSDPPYALVSIVKRFGREGSAACKVPDGGTGAYARASAGFMGKTWDTGETAFATDFWAECLRILKPGGHVLAFSGTRTYHRLAVAIEDAGFEIRDMTAWLYGSGFPKSHNVGKSTDDPAHAGLGTALKPALEPIVLARKPLQGTVAANVLAHGTGSINIDGCRVPVDQLVDASQLRTMNRSQRDSGDGWGMSTVSGDTPQVVRSDGRWPANVIHDGSEEVVSCFPDSAGQQGDVRGSEPSRTGDSNTVCYGEYGRVGFAKRSDSGSAARFFYTAKADALDRIGSKHPTVKPVDLMQYLCRLVTPPGGVVLDPFAGTGTTAEAAFREGFNAVLIEREPEYQADIRRRMALTLAGPDERKRESIKAKGASKPFGDGELFFQLGAAE